MNTTITINPGSENIENTTEVNAIENIKHFIVDCEVTDLKFIRIPNEDYGDGRYAFLIWKGTRCHEIQMPGLPLDKVRFIDEKSQNIWNFPRLYVDDSSWIWKFAMFNEDNFDEVEEY